MCFFSFGAAGADAFAGAAVVVATGVVATGVAGTDVAVGVGSATSATCAVTGDTVSFCSDIINSSADGVTNPEQLPRR